MDVSEVTYITCETCGAVFQVLATGGKEIVYCPFCGSKELTE